MRQVIKPALYVNALIVTVIRKDGSACASFSQWDEIGGLESCLAVAHLSFASLLASAGGISPRTTGQGDDSPPGGAKGRSGSA